MSERCAAGTEPAPACIEADRAFAFVFDQLGQPDRAEVERRIDGCPRCRGMVAEAARGGRSTEATTRIERPNVPASVQALDSIALHPGEVVGRYIVDSALGAGGMGVVSIAHDPELRRAVVIKLVRPDVFCGGEGELEARLRREAQAMAQLSHPNVVQIFDIGRHRDRVFLAMELVTGQTLETWLGERARSIPEILAMFRQAGSGLDAAHRAGLVHRDFKPANVLVGGDGVAKVTDFGLARVASQVVADEPAGGRSTQLSGEHAVLTHEDALIGTPAYMAPEQHAGRPVDARTDQYAFAMTLLDALLRQNAADRRIVATDPADVVDAALAEAGVSSRVRMALARALSTDPSERFSSLGELLGALVPLRRQRGWWIAIGLALCTGGVVTWLAMNHHAGNACTAETSRRWTPEHRARVTKALAARPRAFSTWSAERVTAAIDAAADALGKLEVARCEGKSEPDACVLKRLATFDRVVTTLATNPPADPWPLVRAIERCDDTTLDTSALRAELHPEVTADVARAIAERARAKGDDGLVADALEIAGLAFTRGDVAAAERDLRAMDALGERIGDDATRGRALLHLIELARWQGDHDAVVRDADTLSAILVRHGRGARDELEVAMAEAAAFTDVGDLERAATAWDRANEVATAISSDDARLESRVGRARSLQVLRLDLAAARAGVESAIASVGSASVGARANAFTVLGDIALGQHDGVAATTAFAEARRLVPLGASVRDRIRAARARALVGDVEAALADLDAVVATDGTTTLRLEIGRGMILRDAHREAEAYQRLDVLAQSWRDPFVPAPNLLLSAQEQLDAILAYCEVADLLNKQTVCVGGGRLVSAMHPRAADRARVLIASARAHVVSTLTAMSFEKAIVILVEVKAPPVEIAELQWERARVDEGTAAERAAFARAARAAFAAVGQTDRVAAIDAYLRVGITVGPQAVP